MTISRRHMIFGSLAMTGALAGCGGGERVEETPLLSVARVRSVKVNMPSSVNLGPTVSGLTFERKRLATDVARTDGQIVQDVERVLKGRVVGLGSGPTQLDLVVTLQSLQIIGKADRLLFGLEFGSGFEASFGTASLPSDPGLKVSGYLNTRKEAQVLRDVNAEYQATLQDFAAKMAKLLMEEGVRQ